MGLFEALVETVVPAIVGAITRAAASRKNLVEGLRRLADEIERGDHIPDTALSQARSDGGVLDRLLSGKS